LHVHVLELHEPAVEGHRLARPQRAHHVDGFVEPRPALLHGNAAGIEFAGELTAHSGPEHETPTGQVIERDDLLRDRRGGT